MSDGTRTTPRSAGEILFDPRWDDDPIALWDAVLADLGYEEATRIWMDACRECDLAAAEADDD